MNFDERVFHKNKPLFPTYASDQSELVDLSYIYLYIEVREV